MFFVFDNIYYGLLLPLLGFIVLIGLYRLDIIFYLIAVTTPIALNTESLDMSFGIALPSEPLMAGVLLIFILRHLQRNSFDWRIVKHPITIAIAFNLSWLFLTSITSEMKVVSFKMFTARLWFVVSCYLLAVEVFKDPKNIQRFVWLHTIPLCLVIGYTMFRLVSYGVDKQHAHWVMDPFYKDHAIYGAAIAMFMPFLVGFFWSKSRSNTFRLVAFSVLAILIIGQIFSYSRAAWVSLVGAAGVFLVMKLRIKFRYLAVVGVIGAVFGFMQLEQIIIDLQRNKIDSGTDFAEHVQSISNIATDDSNLERLNRWDCALSMFLEQPLLGHGPGTYAFLYAPYQRPENITLISTNFGDLGNAHSEFLGPLAEQGVLGFISIVALIAVVIYTGVRLYFRLKDTQLKMLVMSALLGLITYYIHGILNNYLDQDKAAMPFFALTAVIVAIDVYHREEEDKEGPEVQRAQEN